MAVEHRQVAQARGNCPAKQSIVPWAQGMETTLRQGTPLLRNHTLRAECCMAVTDVVVQGGVFKDWRLPVWKTVRTAVPRPDEEIPKSPDTGCQEEAAGLTSKLLYSRPMVFKFVLPSSGGSVPWVPQHMWVMQQESLLSVGNGADRTAY